VSVDNEGNASFCTSFLFYCFFISMVLYLEVDSGGMDFALTPPSLSAKQALIGPPSGISMVK